MSLPVRFFTDNELGDWDKMIDGLVNVRNFPINFDFGFTSF